MNALSVLRTAAAGLLLAATVTACSDEGGGGDGEGPAELRIAYQDIPNGDLIVRNQGWLEEELDMPVRWVRFDSGAAVNKALDDHVVDIGLVGTSPVALALTSGVDYQVAWVHNVIGRSEALVAREGSGLAAGADLSRLAKRTVAVPFGSTAHYSLLAALDRADVNPNDVDVVDLQPGEIQSAWRAGTIDAAYVWEPALGTLRDDGGVEILSSADLAEDGIVTGDLGVVSNDLVDNYPDVVQTWVDAQDRAVTMIAEDPEEAQSAIADELDSTPEAVAEAMTGYTYPVAGEQATDAYLGGKRPEMAEHLLAAALFLKDYPQSAKFLKEHNVYLPDPTVEQFVDAIDATFVSEAGQ